MRKQYGLYFALMLLITLVGTVVSAQGIDCSAKKCIHLPLIARPLPEPTATATATATSTSVPTPTQTQVPELPGIGLPNGGFEQGPTIWSFGAGTTAELAPQLARSGSWSATLSVNDDGTATLTQRVDIPTNAEYLVFWYTTSSSQTDCEQIIGSVKFDNDPTDDIDPDSFGQFQEFCQSAQALTYKQKQIYVEPLVGQNITLIFELYSANGTAQWRLDDMRWQFFQ